MHCMAHRPNQHSRYVQNIWSFQAITDYKGMHSQELPSDTSLPDELDYFNARFEAYNTEKCMRAPAVLEDCVITLSAADVSKAFNLSWVRETVASHLFNRQWNCWAPNSKQQISHN